MLRSPSQTHGQEGPPAFINTSHPAPWKILLFVLSISLQKSTPVHPNHDIKFPSRLQGLGKFQGDINRTWKITTQRKAVLDPTSDTTRTPLFFFIGAWQLPRFRIPESLCSWLASDGVTGPAEPWPRDTALPSPPPWAELWLNTRARYPQHLPSPLHPAHLQGPAHTSLLQAGLPSTVSLRLLPDPLPP